MTARTLPDWMLDQLQSYVDAGDATNYYKTLDAWGHDYGNLALQAATDSGFGGVYANNFMENKAREFGVPLDRNQIMRDLMRADLTARRDALGNAIPTRTIRDYHWQVFADKHGLPKEVWTGTFLDERAGPAMWCWSCNSQELQGQGWSDAIGNLLNNLANDWQGTSDSLSNFIGDAVKDGVFSETVADLILQETGNLVLAGIVKAGLQAIPDALSLSVEGWKGIFDQLENLGHWLGQNLPTPYDIQQLFSDLVLAAKGWTPPRRDPLVLDLDGDGIETVGLNAASPILFEHDADGVKTATGWVKPDDGFLVLDRNGNGLIDSGRELFGDATLKSNGQLAVDGFDALADLDSNHDGQVNAADSAFGALRLWRDLNQDGISQAAELFTLASQGIAGIRVAQTANNQVLANRNQIADLGTFIKTDGSTGTLGQVADVNLVNDAFRRQFTDTIPLTAATQSLPDMRGSGLVRDLREAANDEVLKLAA